MNIRFRKQLFDRFSQVAREPRARDYLQKVSAFFAGVGAEGLVDGYTLDGRPAPDPRSPPNNPGSAVFVGCAAAGAMHDPRYASFVDAAYALAIVAIATFMAPFRAPTLDSGAPR